MPRSTRREGRDRALILVGKEPRLRQQPVVGGCPLDAPVLDGLRQHDPRPVGHLGLHEELREDEHVAPALEIEQPGGAPARLALRAHQPAASQPTIRMTKRRMMPSVKGTPAALAAITVAKGLMVEPRVPMPAPIMMMATPVAES